MSLSSSRYQSQGFCTLTCCGEEGSEPVSDTLFPLLQLLVPCTFIAGTITCFLALACGIVHDCPCMTRYLLCGVCCRHPPPCCHMRVKTEVSEKGPIVPIADYQRIAGERRVYYRFYGEERACECWHCCSCYDDLLDTLPDKR